MRHRYDDLHAEAPKRFDEKLAIASSGKHHDSTFVADFRDELVEDPGRPQSSLGDAHRVELVVDGDDNVWISNFAGVSGQIAHLCGVRTETCPPGMKTGEQISPPLGFVGGGLQMQTFAVDLAGNVWVMNNWQLIDSCFPGAPEALTTLCGGQGVTVFYGMAKPVRAPQIGPARPVE